MDNKILILGAKGNLGEQLVKVFQNDKDVYEIIAWDRAEIDITDKELITKKIGDIKPALIINCAAFNAVDKCEEEKGYVLAKKLNGDAPGFLALAALECGAVFVHYSSDYVFDGKNRHGYTESDETKPINKYGETKQMGEKEIIKLSGQGLKWYLIRTQKLFGPQGESEAAKPSFFDIMLNLAKEKNEIEVVNEEKGRFTYTPDLAKATKNLAESGSPWGIYHITNTYSANWYRAAKELFKIVDNKNIKLTPVAGKNFPRPAKRPKYSELISTKMPELRDWREALREYLGANHE
jgi:dTDP-4-dehydrorhamnose reductase